MANPELVKTLDFILNRCDEQEIEIVAESVVRRRRDLTMFGGASAIPDPRRMAKEINAQFKMEESIETLQESIRDYAIRIIRKEAPELTDAQIEELTRSWVPEGKLEKLAQGQEGAAESAIPQDLLSSMVEQFVSFSLGQMEDKEDQALRKEMGQWPDKYWKAFPQVIRLLVTDYIKGEINETEYRQRLGLALSMK